MCHITDVYFEEEFEKLEETISQLPRCIHIIFRTASSCSPVSPALKYTDAAYLLGDDDI
jgi:hypothetical protein